MTYQMAKPLPADQIPEGCVQVDALHLLCLKQVLEMDVKHGMPRAYGISVRQALINLGLIPPETKQLSKTSKQEWLDYVTKEWDGVEAARAQADS